MTADTITTVTRRVYRLNRFAAWYDAAGLSEAAQNRISVQAVALMTLGAPVDADTFRAHLGLGSDGAAVKDNRIVHYFEHDDIAFELMDLWTRDCTLHTIHNIEVIWDESRKDELGPAPISGT